MRRSAGRWITYRSRPAGGTITGSPVSAEPLQQGCTERLWNGIDRSRIEREWADRPWSNGMGSIVVQSTSVSQIVGDQFSMMRLRVNPQTALNSHLKYSVGIQPLP